MHRAPEDLDAALQKQPFRDGPGLRVRKGAVVDSGFALEDLREGIGQVEGPVPAVGGDFAAVRHAGDDSLRGKRALRVVLYKRARFRAVNA